MHDVPPLLRVGPFPNPDETLAVNVSQLLKAPAGERRKIRFHEPAPMLWGELHLAGALSGQGELFRSPRGIVAVVDYGTRMEFECSRCLESFSLNLPGHVEDEYLPTTDVRTGLPLPVEGDCLPISPDHVLDLSEAIRQDILVRAPMRPLCRASCRGLCAECGTNLNVRNCGCQPDQSHSPFGALAGLLG